MGDLGSAMQGLNGAKVTETAKGRMVGNFLATPGGFAGGPIDFLVGLLGQFLGNIADDANDITLEGPQDLPDLIHDFFADLPLVGIIVDIFDAMLGTYDGDDPVLNGIQNLFALIRRFLELITNPVGALTDVAPTVVTQFFSNLQKYMQGITVTADPAGFFTGLGNVAQNLIDKLVQGLGGTGSGHSVDDVHDLLASTTGRLDDVEEAITRLEDVSAFAPVTPSYVSDVQDMASCSRNACKTISIGSAGSMSCSDSAHSHAAHSHSATWVPATYSPERYANISGIYQSPVDYVPIVVDRKGVVDKLRWKTGADDSIFGIDAYYMALCVYNKATGAIEKVWDSGNIKDTTANVSGSSREVELAMGIDQECTPGQLLFVAHQQIAPGAFQSTRSIGCEPLSGDGRPSSLAPLDGAMLRTPGRYGSIPSTIQASTLTRLNSQQLWAAVSVDTSGGS